MTVTIKTDTETLYEIDMAKENENDEYYEIETEKIESILSKRIAVSYLINFNDGINAFEASTLGDLKPEWVKSQVIIVN